MDDKMNFQFQYKEIELNREIEIIQEEIEVLLQLLEQRQHELNELQQPCSDYPEPSVAA